MSAMQVSTGSDELIERALVMGDLDGLRPAERTAYYSKVCESLGLNPLTQPFTYIKLNGKTVLYAKRDTTDQLRKIHNVSIVISRREHVDDLCIVTARATTPDGRTDESTGAVSLAGLKGENLANAMMKAETKAKRRVTLSICGLGWLDETEVADVRGAVHVEAPPPPQSSGDLVKQLEASIDTPSWPAFAERHRGALLSAANIGDLLNAWTEAYKAMKDLDAPADLFAELASLKDERKTELRGL